MGVAVLFASFFLFILIGLPIALALGGSALLYIAFFANVSPIIVTQQILASVNTYTLLAVPFFIMAGALMETGGISKRIVSFCQALVGHFTGGLALVVVLASVFFAAMTGSGVAACAAVGGIMIPMMVENGYDSDFACALQATSGIFGPLIPPSIVMVLYAVYANQSVSTMLMAGVGPGILQAGMVCILAIVICHRRGYKGVGKFSFKNVCRAFCDSFWALLAPVIILGGIYSGICTATEASGVACFYSIIVGLFIYREMNFRQLMSCLGKAMKSTGNIMLIVGASGAFSWVLTRERIASKAAAALLSITDSKVLFLVCAMVILLILGCFIDSVPITTIMTPILAPMAMQYGISLVHLGGLMVSGTCIGLITPPMGLNLFMGAQVGNRPIHKVIAAVKPFIIVTLIGFILVAFIPGITTFLPSLL
ncbi:TRAP transporter large permease [uncultured Dysosmobacter sp.]|uniref:TRAP transporter large permease n=1 Tax=uncultured Dysosmobacter sp. TaxID=2591384 RepID=UPI0026073760|nr:TRAP transporter large permease [uncultured Dysosmobacter sp.]